MSLARRSRKRRPQRRPQKTVTLGGTQADVWDALGEPDELVAIDDQPDGSCAAVAMIYDDEAFLFEFWSKQLIGIVERADLDETRCTPLSQSGEGASRSRTSRAASGLPAQSQP